MIVAMTKQDAEYQVFLTQSTIKTEDFLKLVLPFHNFSLDLDGLVSVVVRAINVIGFEDTHGAA